MAEAESDRPDPAAEPGAPAPSDSRGRFLARLLLAAAAVVMAAAGLISRCT